MYTPKKRMFDNNKIVNTDADVIASAIREGLDNIAQAIRASYQVDAESNGRGWK